MSQKIEVGLNYTSKISNIVEHSREWILEKLEGKNVKRERMTRMLGNNFINGSKKTMPDITWIIETEGSPILTENQIRNLLSNQDGIQIAHIALS